MKKDHPHHLTKYEGKGTKNFEIQSSLFKNPNFQSLLWVGENLDIYTTLNHHFKIQLLNIWSWENLCPNWSFTVENKMGDSHKRGWSYFKLNINDSDIPFPKILRIYQWIGKNIFHWGKSNEPIKLIRNLLDWRLKYRSLLQQNDIRVIRKVCSLKTSNFWPTLPLFIPVHFKCRMLMNFWMKI